MKKIGDTIYIHKSALNQLNDIQFRRYLEAKELIPTDWDWSILSINKEEVAFTKCGAWDLVDEPVVQSRYVVKNGKAEFRDATSKNPFIYHRKYLFVNDDYTGFNVKKNKRRGKIMDKLNLDTKRIGRYDYWQEILKKHKELRR